MSLHQKVKTADSDRKNFKQQSKQMAVAFIFVSKEKFKNIFQQFLPFGVTHVNSYSERCNTNRAEQHLEKRKELAHMEQTLELVFKTAEGNTKVITVTDPTRATVYKNPRSQLRDELRERGFPIYS